MALRTDETFELKLISYLPSTFALSFQTDVKPGPTSVIKCVKLRVPLYFEI